MKSTSEKIIICESCKGSGRLEKIELEDYHNNIYNRWFVKCNRCNGFGRLKETIIIEELDIEEVSWNKNESKD